jgi:hypothetical protein
MALTKDIQFSGAASITSNGATCHVDEMTATFEGCYIRVGSVSSSKTEATAVVSFLESEGGKLLYEQIYGFAIDLAGDNPIKQAYEHLKTLPEFEGAEDC